VGELSRQSYPVGEVVYLYWDDHDPPRVGDVIDLDNGQRAAVLSAKCSDGAHEARKLTARVLGNYGNRTGRP
jgi:hypothetical protein